MRPTSQLPARCSKATASCTALDYRHALAIPIGLADDIGASIHATIREYVERHPNPTGLVITGRMVRPERQGADLLRGPVAVVSRPVRSGDPDPRRRWAAGHDVQR